ncbi:MAG: GTP-binding protein [Caldilineales bacterium]|nr:GTP-binding protein [Caldilineales bacterium]
MSLKVCLLGDFAVGKTSLVSRFVHDIFSDKYLSTIGVKVSRKTLALPVDDELVELTLLLWDLAGSEDFDRMRASYLRGAAGALCVHDLTRAETLASLGVYVQDLRRVNPAARVVVVSNKSDLLGEEGAEVLAEAQSVARHLDAPWHLTSAKTGEGVEEAFRCLGRLLIQGPTA